MTIRWITPLLGTAPADGVGLITDEAIIDVRDLVDKVGNRPDAMYKKIKEGVASLDKGIKTIVCCDYGISRSNAIAAGIISMHEDLSFEEAVRVVQAATGETEIKLEPLDAVRKALNHKPSLHKSTDKRSVLVTGGSGFIGRAVCKLLEREFIVIAPSSSQLDIESGSTQLSLLVMENDIDCIIHLANPRVYTSNIALGKTMTMLRNVLEVCVSNDVGLVYPSGWEVYSGYSGSLLVDETVPALPLGPYGETKYLAEFLIKHWEATTNLRSAIIRSSPVYGPGSDKPKFIYNFIEKAKKEEKIITHHYLNGSPALDLLHIDDFVNMLFKVVQKRYFGVLNVGSGVITSTKEIAEILKLEIGSISEIEQTQIESNTPRITMDYTKADKTLNWKPKIKLQEGLKNIVAELI